MVILPKPLFQREKEETYLLNYSAYVVLAPDCTQQTYRQAVMLLDAIEKNTGYRLHLTKGEERPGDIKIQYSGQDGDSEAYRLTIGRQGVRIEGAKKGVLYGIQTLIQILEQSGAELPGLEIEDEPKLPYRGVYLDITRGRVPKLSYYKKLADEMMRYKLNQLQLYIEHTYLFRDFGELWRDDTPLTPEEVLELDAYCSDRGIELVPSISTCSHFYKLLRTKQWKGLCELENSDREPYTAWGKQVHHTIDISNKDSIELVKGMLREYRALFRSSRFNICADETFDMGKGRSMEYCREKGMGNAYAEYVRELCQCVLEMGCEPMMWGDVICKYPELLSMFPKETVFLNWGYAADVSDEVTKIFAEKNVKFYNCPGVSGWSRMCNDYKSAYENIRRMASYTKENHGIGLLNTVWGDYYHTSHPDFALLGLIYGAQFSWGDSMEASGINRAASILEYGAQAERIGDLLWEINENCLYSWMNLCIFKENYDDEALREETLNQEFADTEKAERLREANGNLENVIRELARKMKDVKPEKRSLLAAYQITADGCRYLNTLGTVIAKRECQKEQTDWEKDWALAKELEQWFYHYKAIWRTTSKESELYRLQAVIDGYCDYLREGTH